MVTVNAYSAIVGNYKKSAKMPVMFIGHGSPMNAIEKNAFSAEWEKIGKAIPPPESILVVSAHWLTRGTFVTTNDKPETIHDFHGFPAELYSQQYPAPGHPPTAAQIVEFAADYHIAGTNEWGIDHGAWSVLLPMFPKADIPVLQLSIDAGIDTRQHYELAGALRSLRDKGVLIIGSGNIVHNLRMLKWGADDTPYDWNLEFDEFVKTNVSEGNDEPLIQYEELGHISRLAHPTNEHYIPLLYTVGMRKPGDELLFFNEAPVMGSLSMRSFILY